ncbi:DNA primase [Wenzhouxiangella sp. AB-CW3]|uniref:DNA primase n=1 Tax=Wenzhouxiangella sp. AB-CW3 TaxID=2771012 RepID=UPI00168BAF60|nr:DNA primase [Wenzhouxiangella sp. AB-CW3]QOC22854.1 DNA primase [Wenzhouxiangella sp. AB-CW3]
MAGRIPESFIETLIERSDIVEVVGSRVDLKPAGRGEFKARCPFHDEKTPSFTVSSDKQFYHCFGCGAHGTVIGFVMEYDGLEFPAAIEELAARAGLEVPREGGHAPVRKNDRLYEALGAAQAWFRRQLGASEPARNYLKGRGFDKATVDEFGIGYAPDAWQALADELTAQGFRLDELEQAGLITRKQQRATDKFRDRVMFPIHDRRGRVIAFGGRALGERGPKYMNSPETPVFHKGRELYRLYQVRRGGLPKRLLVVEGYMDCAALFQYGFDNAVATLGTSVTGDHMELMFRASPVVVFCFDGDRAGRQAAWRGLEAALPVMRDNREVRFLFLPEGEDPDSLVRSRGQAELAERVDQARPLSSFFFDHLAEEVDMTSIDGRARMVAMAQPYLDKIPTGAFADLMRHELEKRAGHGGTSGAQPASNTPRRQPRGLDADRPLTPVQYAVALIVQHPALARDVPEDALDGPGGLRGVDFLRELIDFCRSRPHFSPAKLLESWRERPESQWLARLAGREVIEQQATPEEREMAMSAALAQTLARIRRQQIQTRVRELQQAQLREGGLDEIRTRELRRLLGQRMDEEL